MAFRRKRKTAAKTLAKPGDVISQTAIVGGQRVVVTQRMNAAGKVVTTTKAAAVLEVELQAAQVVALKLHPDYGRRFVLAGDQNAARRGPKAISDAKRTGMTPGEPDVRLYVEGGRLILVENKEANGILSQDQKDRHAELRALGFDVYVVWAKTPDEAANQIIALLEDILQEQSDARQHAVERMLA